MAAVVNLENKPNPRGRLSGHTEAHPINLADDQLEWTWRINDYGITVEVTNASVKPIKLLWSEATFTDDSGSARPVHVSRGRWSLWNRSKGPIGITELGERQAFAFDIFPQGYLSAGGSINRRTLFDPPGYRVGYTPDEIIAIAQPAVGKRIQFIIPSVAAASRYEYEFIFTVNEVRARRTSWSLI